MYFLDQLPPVMAAMPLVSQDSQTSKKPTSKCSYNSTNTQDILKNKIDWATQQLQVSVSVDYTIQLCNLIKSAADAISSLQTINSNCK